MALTIRLEEKERRLLDLIQDHLEESTKSKTIVKMITSFMETEKALESAWNKCDALEGELNSIKNILRMKKDLQETAEKADRDLMELL